MSWLLDSRNESNYLAVCRTAVYDDEVFSMFRRSDPFSLIVENSPLKSGLEYYECIKAKYPWLLEHMGEFVSSDKHGGPHQYAIGDHLISPSTMRYIKTLGDLDNFFRPISEKNIVEIGGGYGGLCKIIHDVCLPDSYTIYDLPEVCQLQRKFLSKFDVNINIRTEIEEPAAPIDLLIAMYSWSELTLDVQKEYLDKVISKAKECYIMLNYQMEDSYRMLREAFPNADIQNYNLFYDDNNTEYVPYNRFIIIKN